MKILHGQLRERGKLEGALQRDAGRGEPDALDDDPLAVRHPGLAPADTQLPRQAGRHALEQLGPRVKLT
jgi:hypothetical protein